MNFRDRDLELVRGINATLWTPYEDSNGVVKGLALGLPLTGAAEITGLALGAGIGVNRTFTGIGLAPIGSGAGEGIRGIGVGGVGLGSGGDIEGLMIGGVGLGAGGHDVRGLLVAPAYFKIEDGGTLRGVSVSAFNNVRGSQRGLTIGLLNIADELHGLQVGVLNIARNKKSFSVLPLLSYHR
ncbi:MAG: hypothetical protein Q8N53_10205 [Longimicrobiales bacterium]|nr:hypothetical protein [Longimicrobiales bacterium]